MWSYKGNICCWFNAHHMVSCYLSDKEGTHVWQVAFWHVVIHYNKELFIFIAKVPSGSNGLLLGYSLIFSILLYNLMTVPENSDKYKGFQISGRIKKTKQSNCVSNATTFLTRHHNHQYHAQTKRQLFKLKITWMKNHEYPLKKPVTNLL